MTTISILPKESNKSFSEEQQLHKTEEGIEEEWTVEYLVDQLFLNLVRIKETITNSKGKTIQIHKYYRQARRLMGWIPLAKLPSNEFVIYVSDLSTRIRKEIEYIIPTPAILQYVLTQAVGRIFENLDFEYYHLSIAQNLKVRLEK